MTNNSKKYLIWTAVVLVAFVITVCYASEIRMWFMSKLTELIIIAAAFLAGWLLGRYGGGRHDCEKNARNITEAQK